VRNKEEVKLPVNDFGLFNKAIVDVGTLRWVIDEVLTVVLLSLLEESLTDPLVHDDQGDLWSFLFLLFTTVSSESVFKCYDLIELG